MRNISQLVASLVLLASQVHDPFAGMTALAQASAPAAETLEVSFSTTSANPFVVSGSKHLDYESEVLAPLHAAQAAAAKAAAEAAAKAAAARKKAVVTITQVPARVMAAATPENMLALRLCEAGSIYTRSSGNGYYGAYQYSLGTWANYQGYARPDLAR
jgi:hypothetical protein